MAFAIVFVCENIAFVYDSLPFFGIGAGYAHDPIMGSIAAARQQTPQTPGMPHNRTVIYRMQQSLLPSSVFGHVRQTVISLPDVSAENRGIFCRMQKRFSSEKNGIPFLTNIRKYVIL